jgi:predicted Rossmann-fold nucleotide-binding protein
LIANINGYWDPLLTLITHMRERAFVPESLAVNFLVAERVEDILPTLRRAALGRAEAEEAMAIPAERL